MCIRDSLKEYKSADQSSPMWNSIEAPAGKVFQWNEFSTYIQNPPFFKNMVLETNPVKNITGARVLAKLGDSVTTDHISPAGSFSPDSPAGKYLLEKGTHKNDFNSYGSRRGNDRVMTRGTFANIRLRNELVPENEGGFTKPVSYTHLTLPTICSV